MEMTEKTYQIPKDSVIVDFRELEDLRVQCRELRKEVNRLQEEQAHWEARVKRALQERDNIGEKLFQCERLMVLREKENEHLVEVITGKQPFDRNAYQRDYMRKRRAAEKTRMGNDMDKSPDPAKTP
jgi:uncharacterized protein YhaN